MFCQAFYTKSSSVIISLPDQTTGCVPTVQTVVLSILKDIFFLNREDFFKHL